MREILVDIRHASRVLTSAPVTSAVAVLSLALAVAGAASVFAVIDAFVLRTVPVDQPHRLVSVAMVTRDGAPSGLSAPMFRAFAERQRVFSHTTGWADYVLNVEVGGQPGLGNVWAVTDDFFTMLGESGRTRCCDTEGTRGASPPAFARRSPASTSSTSSRPGRRRRSRRRPCGPSASHARSPPSTPGSPCC